MDHARLYLAFLRILRSHSNYKRGDSWTRQSKASQSCYLTENAVSVAELLVGCRSRNKADPER
jgi:hypothetical protein